MKTIIYLSGPQGSGKTHFLNNNDLVELNSRDIKSVADLLHQPSIICLTSNSDTNFFDIEKLVNDYENAMLIKINVPFMSYKKNTMFFKRLLSFINNLRPVQHP